MGRVGLTVSLIRSCFLVIDVSTFNKAACQLSGGAERLEAVTCVSPSPSHVQSVLMAGTWRVCVATITVVCVVLPCGVAAAAAVTQDNSTVSPLPQVTVALKVLQSNATEKRGVQPRSVAVLSMAEGGAEGNRSLVWDSGLPPTSPVSPQNASHSLPLPVVTVASRLLYSPARKERKERDRNTDSRNVLVGDIPVREIEFEPVPAGEQYRTDTTHAQSTMLAWAGAFLSLLQPATIPLGELVTVSSIIISSIIIISSMHAPL